MKIIRDGIEPGTYRCTCRACQSIVDYERSEAVETIHAHDLTYYLLVCPCCAYVTKVSDALFNLRAPAPPPPPQAP